MTGASPGEVSFAVTAMAIDGAAAPSRPRLPGRLIVGRSGVSFAARSGGAPIDHISPAVAITVAFLRAPWAGGALLVQGEERCVRITFPVLLLARLRRALSAAGVPTQVDYAWRARPGPRRAP